MHTKHTAQSVCAAAKGLGEEHFPLSLLTSLGIPGSAVRRCVADKLIVAARKGSKVLTHKTGRRGRPAVLYTLSAKGRKVAG